MQAKSIVGIDELDLFKNNGFSETVMFTFGDECKPPVGFSGETISPKRIGAKWKTAFNQTEFTVRYREKGDAEAAWFEEETFLSDIKINGLKPDTEYEMQVSAGCGTLTSDYTPLITTRTELDRNDEFACGATPDVFGLENTTILPSLRKGDYIYVNDFDIRIDSIGGGNGVYSGTGIAEMPFLSLVKVRVRFSGITINTDYRMIDGQVFSVYNPNSRSMVDLDKEDDITEGETDSDATSDGTTSDEFNGTEVVVDADIDSVYVNDAGSIAVQMADGTTQTIIPETNEDGTSADTRITDSNGDSWIVDSEGSVSENPALGNQEEVVVSAEEEAAANQLTIIYDGETYETGATIVTINKKLDQEKVEIKDNLDNVIPFEDVKWEGVTVDAENKSIDFSAIVDKEQTFEIEAKGLKSNYTVEKIKAKFSRASETGTRINAYGYDNMNQGGQVEQHHVNVKFGEETWLEVKKVKDVKRIKFIVDPPIATVTRDDDGKDIYAKISANLGQTGDAVVKVVDKKDETNVLSSINLHIYKESGLEGEVYTVYDPSYQQSNTSQLSATAIKDKANGILKHAVASTGLKQITSTPINFDLNGNKQLDYFINVGGPKEINHELYEVYKSSGGKDANNILLLQEEPIKRFYFMEDFIVAGKTDDELKQIVLGYPQALTYGFEVGKYYVISAPDGKKSETFKVEEIKKRADKKYVLVINKKLKHDHLATIDKQNGHFISYSETNALQKLAGLQNYRDPENKESRALLSVTLKVSNDFIGTIVAHEQLHGGGLGHVTDKSNIMHFSAAGSFDINTGAVIGNQSLSTDMPLRYKDLDSCEKTRNSQDKEECNANGSTENQWETLKRPGQ
jgi:hypothetical protein